MKLLTKHFQGPFEANASRTFVGSDTIRYKHFGISVPDIGVSGPTIQAALEIFDKDLVYYELIEESYEPTQDTVPQKNKTYYILEEEEYEEVTSFPRVFKEKVDYYELNEDDQYVKTRDETPQENKTYYIIGSITDPFTINISLNGSQTPVTFKIKHTGVLELFDLDCSQITVTFNQKFPEGTVMEADYTILSNE